MGNGLGVRGVERALEKSLIGEASAESFFLRGD